MKKTIESSSNLPYLDISISICNNKYVTEVYDRRGSFKFEIVICIVVFLQNLHMVFMCHNSSEHIDIFSSFLTSHRLLTERLIEQGFWHSKVCKSSKKFAKRQSIDVMHM